MNFYVIKAAVPLVAIVPLFALCDRADALTAQPAALIAIDDPEVLPASPESGVLFDGMLPASPTRLFLFESLKSTHAAEPGPSARYLIVLLKNVSARPIELTLLGNVAGPSDQPTTVGEAATGCFLVNRLKGLSAEHQLSAGETLRVVSIKLSGSGSTVSGIIDVATDRPRDLRLTALASSDPSAASGALQHFDEAKPWRAGVFDLSSVKKIALTVDAAATPQGVHPTLILGDDCHPLPSISDGRPKPHTPAPHGYACYPRLNGDGYYDLHGDYGVERTITATLTNSGSSPAAVQLYVRPRGGDVWGSFLVDSEIVQIANARSVEDTQSLSGLYEIYSWEVNPGQVRRVAITTMGQGEAAYPAWIYLNARQSGSRAAPRPNDALTGAAASIATCPSVR